VPIYEYECGGCSRRVSLLIRRIASPEAPPNEAPRCPRCGSAELSRLMSRFATPKSEDARLAAAADPSQYGDLDENDPQAVARLVKRMGDEMGEDLPEEFDEVVDRLESGEDPEAIEKDMPDLGGDDGGDDDFDF